MTSTRFGIVAVLACAGLGLFTGSASAQTPTNYTWNNTGTDPTLTSSWSSPSGPGFPGSTGNLDNAFFNVLGTFGTSTQFNPDLTSLGTVPLNGTVLNSTANFTGWSFTGTGSTIVQPALTTYGPVTHTINGPNIAGIAANSLGAGVPPVDLPLVVTVTGGSTLAFQGNSAITGTFGGVNISGGTLKLDNSGTNLGSRLPTSGNVTINGGGTLELIGNAGGTTANVGALQTPNNGLGGMNTIVVSPNGASTVLDFANTAAFTLRGGTRTVMVFQSTSGDLGDANGGRITFNSLATSPFLGSAGLLANTAGGGTVGFGIVTDALGTNFATYNTAGTTALGIVSIANPGQSVATVTTVTTASQLAGLTTSTNGQFNAPAGTTTATGTITSASLRITPASGATLAMGANGLNALGLMLDGSNNFAITGTGAVGSGGTHYFYVNNASATLSLQPSFTSSTNAVIFAGPGTVALTGTVNQNAGTAGNNYRISIVGGDLRGSPTQLGLGTTNGVFCLFGGVLEIASGSSLSGTNADFTRALGTSGGNVTWANTASPGTDRGSGGFSAFGSNASVNIGGASATLTWNQANFIADGYALKFGSTQSNAVLQWQNPIALDNGSTTTYLAREINVTAGTGGDKTQMTGVISGSATTDLLKTGTGALELLGMNTYQGNTLIQGGTLIVGNGGTIGTNLSPAGNVVVGNGATLAGVAPVGNTAINGANGGSNSIIVNPGGAIRGGNPTFAGDALGILSTNNGITINSSSTANGILRVEAARTGANAANSSLLTTSGNFNLNPGTGNKFTIDLVNNATNPLVQGENYSVTLATVTSPGSFQLNGATLGAGASIAASNFTLQSSAFAAFSGVSLTLDGTGQNLVLAFTPVPEPGAVLAIAVGALGLGGLVRRRLRRVVPTIAA